MRIYPSTPIPQNSMLIHGESLNKMMKRLANPKVTNTYVTFTDTNIEYIDRTDNPPGTNISDIVNVENPGCIPIYMWYDFDTHVLYFKSLCRNIYLNKNSTYTFTKLSNCKKINLPIYATSITSTHWLFYECSSLVSLDLSHFDTSTVTTMAYMFYDCSSLTSLDLSHFNTSNVTNMTGMFSKCTSLASLDLSNFDTSNVTSMSDTFSYIEMDSLDLSNFDTSKVVNITYMFRNAHIDNIDFSFFNLESVKTMASAFENFQSSNDIIISSNAPNISNMIDTFSGTKVNSIDLGGIQCPNITSMNNCFESSTCIFIVLPSNGNKLKSMNSCFASCTSLTSLDISNFDTSSVTNMSSMFSACSSLTSLDLSNFDTSSTVNMYRMFYYCSSLTSLDLSNFDTSNVTTMSAMFSNCTSLVSLNLSNFDTSNVTDMSYMFSSCTSLTSLDISNFDTSKVENITHMFSYSSLMSLDLSKWILPNVISANYMFYQCSKISFINLENMKTSKNIDMYRMFDSCNNLKDIKMPKSTILAKDVRYMFYYCANLTTIDVSNIDTSNVISFESMFYDCLKITKIIYGDGFKLPDALFNKCIGYNGPTREMYKKCPANKPIGGNWDRGAWFSSSETFYKESCLIPGSDIRKMINGSTKYVKVGGTSTTSPIVDITTDLDARVYLCPYNTTTSTQSISSKNTMVYILNEDCSGMFKNLPDLIEVDLSHDYFNYNEARTKNWKEMFANDPKLTSVKYPKNFDMTEEVYLTTKANNDTNPTWHMFYNTPNAPKPTGGWWDYGTWNDEGTFIKGADIDIAKFRSAFTSHSSTMTAFNKSDVPPTNMVDVFDVSKDENMAIMSWYDTTANIQYWYSENPMVFMDADSTSMFELPSLNVCKSIDLSGLDTRKVTNMNNMFSRCLSLTSLDISNFDTSNVTTMSGMFYNCTKLTSLDISNFDTAKVTTMSSMFERCIKLSSLNLSNFNTSNVTNMSGMFSNCSSLTALDLSHFDMIKCKNISNMFVNCTKLDLCGFENWDVSNLETMTFAFNGCELIESIDLSNWNTPKLVSMDVVFANCTALKTLNLSNFNTSKVKNMRSLVSNCPMLKSLDLSSFDTSSVEYSGSSYSGMSDMFRGNISLSTIIFSDKFVITDQLYSKTTNNNSYNPLYEIYSNCPANKPTGGNWDLGTWTDNGTFIKNT